MLDRTKDIAATAQSWLEDFERACSASDSTTLARLFVADSYWRDALALSWNLKTIAGRDAIARDIGMLARPAAPIHSSSAPGPAAPRWVTRAGAGCVEAIFAFETAIGRGSGILRLVPDAAEDDKLKAWTLLTALEELKGFEEQLNRAGRPIRATFADRTGSICATPHATTPTAIRPCWWSAAARPASPSRRG